MSDKVGKALSWGLGGEMTLQAQEAGSIAESPASLDKEFGCGPKSTEKSLETFKAEARSDEARASKRCFDWDIQNGLEEMRGNGRIMRLYFKWANTASKMRGSPVLGV